MAPVKQKDLAAAIGMNPGNFSTAIRGVRPIPEQQLQILFEALGLDASGRLQGDRVHLWELGVRVEPLRTAADHLFPRGADYAGLWRDVGGLLNLRRATDIPLIAITDLNLRVIVRTRVTYLTENPDPVDPTTVPALRRNLVTAGPEPRMLGVPSERFRAWESGMVTPEEFDQLLAQAGAVSTRTRSRAT